LTGGRLPAKYKAIAEKAYNNAQGGKKLAAAQEIILLTPEFHNLGNPLPQGPRQPEASQTGRVPQAYKALILMMLNGGADTFNMLIPIKCKLYEEYVERRKGIEMKESELIHISATNQVCEQFGVHPKFNFLSSLYRKKQAAFFSNVGNLVQPITRSQYFSKVTPRCLGMFSHSHQQSGAQTLKCQKLGAGPRGVGGRIADALASAGKDMKASSFSLAGNSIWSKGFVTSFEIIDRTHGAVRFGKYRELKDTVHSIANESHGNIYCDYFAKSFSAAIDSSETLGQQLETVLLKTIYNARSRLARQFRQVARLIATKDVRKAERDFFMVSTGGFDTHSNQKWNLPRRFDEIDSALEQFVAEMEAQHLFESVVILQESEFGRTLTFNGAGTDHGWAGNHFVIGGAINGGNIFNDYLSSFTVGHEYDASRGRVIPKYPWESVLVPIAEWMGVDEAGLGKVFPNLQNFNRTSHIVSAERLFKSAHIDPRA
jgi:uncharacterized protein (DUF1501 family)